MANTTTITPAWAYNRIVSFFNTAQSVEDIVSTVKDDPSDGPGRTISANLAARILRERSRFGFRGFTDFAQIDGIRGVGDGTVQDLLCTFNVSAAAAFQQKMYDDHVIYRENWPLEFFRYEIEDKEEFEKMVFDDQLLRNFVGEKIIELSEQRGVDQALCDQMVTDISAAYIDKYSNSIPTANIALALWFYEFDADNWFSWERILEVTAYYLDYYARTNNSEMELRFFKGFVNRGIIQPGITPDDLPVVLNYAEQCVTIWFSTLYD